MSGVAIVTGAGSGIGLSASKALARDGWTVYDFSRTDRAAPNVKHIGCDISDEAQVRAAVSRVIEEQGRIDLLLNNAGFGISGAVEFTRAEEAEKLIRVNLLGADNVTRAVLGTMRAQRGGRILFTSSIAGILPIPFQAWYSVTKAAINAYALALRNEVAPFGVSVCAVMPGDIHTGFTAAREKSAVGDDVYCTPSARSTSCSRCLQSCFPRGCQTGLWDGCMDKIRKIASFPCENSPEVWTYAPDCVILSMIIQLNREGGVP